MFSLNEIKFAYKVMAVSVKVRKEDLGYSCLEAKLWL